MSDLREAAEMALKALENPWEAKPKGVADAIQALRQALAQPEQESFNRLIRIMGTFDLATGHADSWDELLDSLESELRDVLGYHREALRQALAQPNDFIYSQNHAFRISPSTGDFGIGSAPAKTLEHKDWCASLTQVLACHPPRPAPCNCKPEYVDAVNMSQERVDETAKDRHEPVAWVNHDKDGEIEWGRNGYRLPVGTPLYTAPPKREWVGLTDEERQEIVREEVHWSGICRAVEAKLKEKNT